MTSPFVQGLLAKTKTQPNAFIVPARPSLPAAPVATQMGAGKKQYNPFLIASKTDGDDLKDVYGVNRPLSKPMFLGYRDDKAMFGGNRLFILY